MPNLHMVADVEVIERHSRTVHGIDRHLNCLDLAEIQLQWHVHALRVHASVYVVGMHDDLEGARQIDRAMLDVTAENRVEDAISDDENANSDKMR